jgi:hypothetical protein
VRRRDQYEIGVTLVAVSETAEAPFVDQLQELGLHLQVGVSQLVEEQRPPMRHLNEPGARHARAIVGSFLAPEKLDCEQLRRQPGAMQARERLARAGAGLVQPAREHALAGAGLARDQDGAAGGRSLWRLDGERLDGGAATQERVDLDAHRSSFRERPLAAALILEQPLKDRFERMQLDRLGQELVCASLDRPQRKVDRAVAGQNHERHVASGSAQPRQQIEGVAIGQAGVGHHRVHCLGSERLLARCHVAGFPHFVAARFEEVAHARAGPGLIVDDQHAALHGRALLS